MKKYIQFSATEELLDIRYDRVFKAVFTRDSPVSKGALSGLITSLIGKKIAVVSITANEPPIDDIRDKSTRYDISCKTESGVLVNIEMSLNPNPYEPVRLEYYAGKLFTRQNICGSSKNYTELKEAYQIAILARKRFFDDETLVHKFSYYDSCCGISLGGKSQIITVELLKAASAIKKPIREMASHEAWAAFFQYLTDRSKRGKINEILHKEEGIAMAGEVLIDITQEDIEWARKLSREKYILDTHSHRTHAWRTGLAKGKAKGREEGQETATLNIARNALAEGATPEFVQKITGLDLETINQLVANK